MKILSVLIMEKMKIHKYTERKKLNSSLSHTTTLLRMLTCGGRSEEYSKTRSKHCHSKSRTYLLVTNNIYQYCTFEGDSAT